MRVAVAILGLGALAYAILLGALYAFQRKLLCPPDPIRPDPERAGLREA